MECGGNSKRVTQDQFVAASGDETDIFHKVYSIIRQSWVLARLELSYVFLIIAWPVVGRADCDKNQPSWLIGTS